MYLILITIQLFFKCHTSEVQNYLSNLIFFSRALAPGCLNLFLVLLAVYLMIFFKHKSVIEVEDYGRLRRGCRALLFLPFERCKMKSLSYIFFSSYLKFPVNQRIFWSFNPMYLSIYLVSFIHLIIQ